jgi:hypothetical protein
MALLVLKQSDDPKFLLYGELPPSEQSGKGGTIAPAFSGYHGPLQCFPASSPGATVFGGMPAFHLHPGMMTSGMPRASLGVILTGEQAGVLLEQGNGSFMEIEQVHHHLNMEALHLLVSQSLLPCRQRVAMCSSRWLMVPMDWSLAGCCCQARQTAAHVRSI